ncbi:MAG: radical SAM family heme chaperone HemW [Bacteroidales bacterium]|nr:radical SAM family heme chaperone HemW [Bacteroidales bacterium]MBR6161992.1 radical SAM family heme chaperone HemW [Bacteroidales bacterium]
MLYLHIPFCLSKCIYCGFYSVANTRQKAVYLDALGREIRLRSRYLAGTPVRTLYFGGGTPSLLSGEELAGILQTLRNTFQITPDAEITLEANPEQLTPEYCRTLHDLGINRLSVGVQSFQDPVLRFMGRRHTANQALEAIRNAAAAGIDNISIDLIFGVSERSDDQWAEDMETALSLPIRHLSCYALTPEENSILYKQIQRHTHAPVDDDQATRQYEQLCQRLQHSELHHYEVSNFAREGFESRHNSAYWDHTPYLGLGPSAHSFDGKSRQWNPANLSQYLHNIEEGRLYEEREMLDEKALYNETLLLSLRTREGLDINALRDRFGTSRVDTLLEYFHSHVPQAHYTETESRLRLTEAGLWFADGIAGDAFEI